jgi:hypothetical protein
VRRIARENRVAALEWAATSTVPLDAPGRAQMRQAEFEKNILYFAIDYWRDYL